MGSQVKSPEIEKPLWKEKKKRSIEKLLTDLANQNVVSFGG